MSSHVRFLFLAMATRAIAATEPIHTMTLDPTVMMTVPIGTNRVTTLAFPGPISGLDGAGVTADSKVPGFFQLAHTRGSHFLSLRALAPKATANLNVQFQDAIYVLLLEESPSPILSLKLLERQSPVPKAPPQLTPSGLLGLLGKAKAFSLLRDQHPEAVAGAQALVLTNTTDYGDFAVQLEEVVRFDHEDSLVFRAAITNRMEAPLRYDADTFRVRTGNHLYPASVSEASGLVPPHSASPIYVVITGSPGGGRNDLSIHNDFRLEVSRSLSVPQEVVP